MSHRLAVKSKLAATASLRITGPLDMYPKIVCAFPPNGINVTCGASSLRITGFLLVLNNSIVSPVVLIRLAFPLDTFSCIFLQSTPYASPGSCCSPEIFSRYHSHLKNLTDLDLFHNTSSRLGISSQHSASWLIIKVATTMSTSIPQAPTAHHSMVHPQ
jgi:hypothetical protein